MVIRFIEGIIFNGKNRFIQKTKIYFHDIDTLIIKQCKLNKHMRRSSPVNMIIRLKILTSDKVSDFIILQVCRHELNAVEEFLKCQEVYHN